jgi:hypothetical protein
MIFIEFDFAHGSLIPYAFDRLHFNLPRTRDDPHFRFSKMAIVCQNVGDNDKSLLLDEFEITLWEYPWDEAQDQGGRKQNSPTTDSLSHNVKVLDHSDSSSSFPVVKDDADDSMSDEECIEISHWVRTGLFTIFEEENSYVSDTSIQHFRPQLSFETAVDHGRGTSSRLRGGFASPGDSRSKKWRLLSLTKKRFWPRKTATIDEATHASLQDAGTVHGMPIYSVLSILNDLETSSTRTDDKCATPPDVNEEPNRRCAWFRIKHAPIVTRTRTNQLGIEEAPKHKSNEPTTSFPIRPKPKRLLYRVRAWNRFRNRRKNSVERNAPELVDDKDVSPFPPMKSVTTKIIIVGDTNLNVTEKSDRPAFVEESKRTARESTSECRASEGSAQQLVNSQSYSCGYDTIAFVADTLIDITSMIGGSIDHICLGSQDKEERWEGSSLVNVGPSEYVGDLSEVSLEEYMGKLEESNESKCNE